VFIWPVIDVGCHQRRPAPSNPTVWKRFRWF